jgi:hypothetical protein
LYRSSNVFQRTALYDTPGQEVAVTKDSPVFPASKVDLDNNEELEDERESPEGNDLVDENQTQSDDDEDDELPYFDAYDFVNSTWTVGILWSGSNNIDRKRVFLRADGSCVWTDKVEGTWTVNSKTNFFEFTRFWKWWQFKGRRFFQITDYKLKSDSNYYYLDGIVAGWSFWYPLQILGKWQAYREGVDEEEAGVPPWFEAMNDSDIVKG